MSRKRKEAPPNVLKSAGGSEFGFKAMAIKIMRTKK